MTMNALMHRLARFGLATVMIVAMTTPCVAADLSQTARFNITPQLLTDALMTYSEQSGVQVTSSAALVEGKRSASVVGAFSARDALSLLLKGTDLAYEVIGVSTVTIRPISDRVSGGSGAVETSSDEPALRFAQGASSQSDPTASNEGADRMPDKQKVQEIVVTAQKKIERLQDVPVPVTVLRADTLAATNQTRIEDYYTKIPGLSLIYPEGSSGPTIAIRGVTTGGVINANPTVGIVIDDISYGSSNSTADGALAADIDPGELASVEVLRGPQGTLYGASNIGGLLKYVTVDPSTEALSGRFQAGTSFVDGGNDLGYAVRGSVNIPLSETLAVRAGVFSRQDPGYVDNVQSGEKDVNSTDVKGGRLSVLWRPSDAFSLKIGALIQDSEVNGIRNVSVLPGFKDLQQNTLRGTGLYQRKTQAYSAIMNAEIGGASVISATGYSTNDTLRRFEVPIIGILAADPQNGFVDAPGSTFGGAVDVVGSTEKFTQEVRVTFPIGERIEWLLGGFYTRETSSSDEEYGAADISTGSKLGALIGVDSPSRFVDYAGFTNLAFKFTERFDTQLGARVSRNTTSFSAIWSGLLTPIFFPTTVDENNRSVVPFSKSSEAATTYLITPRFRLSSNLMMYARMASGYRPGGPLASCGVEGIPCQFESDTTENYELGIKGSTLAGSLTYDASLYHIDWKKIQLPARSPSGTIAYTGNAGHAKSQGVELSAAWRLEGGFAINGWFAWNEAELTKGFAPPFITLVAAKGDRLPYSSPLSGGLSIDQEFNITSTMTGYAGASASYVDSRKEVFNDTGPRATYASYMQVDFRAGVRYESWSIDAFINNVADERGVLSAGDFVGASVRVPNSYVYIQPRTFGLALSKSF